MLQSTSIAERHSAQTGASPLTGTVPAVGRLLISAIFLFSGFGKIAAPAATVGFIASVGLPFPELSYVLAVVLEIGGGLALLAGLQTRWAALALSGFSLATALIFHNALGDQDQLIHFLKNVAMAGGLLQIAAFGGGRYSVDALHR